ncbi:MAG: galactose-1-epimerase, partial [Pygmaiobacter sp.]
SDDNALTLDYSAASTRDTVINLTNHSYFNLNGAESGSAMGHTLRVCADSFTPIDRDALPTGEIEPVCGTPFDFTAPKALGRDIAQDVTQLHRAGGYDHNFVLNKSAPHALELAAELQGDESGIRMTCTTSCPGLQLYTANFLASPPTGKNGAVIAPRQAICLETQYFPNSMNCPLFEAPILRVGSTYHETTIYKFGE